MSKYYYNLSLFYPHNDIRTKEVVEKVLDNLHRIPLEKLEELTNKF